MLAVQVATPDHVAQLKASPLDAVCIVSGMCRRQPAPLRPLMALEPRC